MADKHSGSVFKRIVLEVSLGTLAALPIGMFLYFFLVVFWASAVSILALLLPLIPYIGIPIVTWMNFTKGMILLLAVSAIVLEVWACRILVRRHHTVFAYTQAVLGLAVSSPFFYWSIVHRKPMLPFWGQ